MKDFENAWHHWTTADILATYTSPFCQHVSYVSESELTSQCGDYGYSFIWCSVPAIKLCGSCLSLPQFRFVSLRTARATYGYSKAEVATIPFMKIPTGLSHPGVVLDLHGRLRPGSKVVLRYSLMTRAEKNGTDPLADIAPCSYNELCSHVSHWTKANTSLFGVMKPTYRPCFRRATNRMQCNVGSKAGSMGWRSHLRTLQAFPRRVDEMGIANVTILRVSTKISSPCQSSLLIFRFPALMIICDVTLR